MSITAKSLFLSTVSASAKWEKRHSKRHTIIYTLLDSVKIKKSKKSCKDCVPSLKTQVTVFLWTSFFFWKNRPRLVEVLRNGLNSALLAGTNRDILPHSNLY